MSKLLLLGGLVLGTLAGSPSGTSRAGDVGRPSGMVVVQTDDKSGPYDSYAEAYAIYLNLYNLDVDVDLPVLEDDGWYVYTH